MSGVKAYELKIKSKQQLEDQLVDLKKELLSLRSQKSRGPSPKIGILRKDIARVLTIINLNQRESVRAFYKGKKYIPKDLRAKKTRAIRRRLSENEAKKITLKQKKKQIAFPQRKFAVKN
ncbi:60S ribosomal protein uL29 [Ascoidea rubescens DSM 1968]|uniref:60S ribosomal protein L35 n=1 Tax=Ascoidea rubescens DSM 1968 TaxID=1344418 RepID=A0A1D2VF58_9ASCO|nr:60S ribosomal protein L35 [Ascoidea rubescens DSM 1968]ODV60291.1 60S ribosomal protein L35 [Ascoidea rubescens DSM 1968]